MKSTINIGIGVWILLFALFLPFSYSFFPSLGIELTNSLAPLSEWISVTVFGGTILAEATTSDSAAQFAQAAILLILAVGIGLILLKQKRYSHSSIHSFLNASAAYILAFFLFKYGFDKLFQFQFYPAEPNTLHTPLGSLSKDILFWSSMGTSASYNTFMGLIEVIPGFLLLHHRTRLLGGLIALGVLVNVLAINFSFDITVKLLSMYLVILSIYVISPFLKNMFSFFVLQTESSIKSEKRINLRPKIRLMVKSLVVVLLFTEVLISYVQIGFFNGREMEKIAHFGSYEVKTADSEMLGIKQVKRIHIHSKGYLILEDSKGHFSDFPIRIAPDQSIIVGEQNCRIFVVNTRGNAEFRLQKDSGEQHISTQKINLDTLPARDDSFHWTVDEMVR